MESLGTAVLELIADVKPLEAGLAKGKAASEEMARSTATGFKGGIQKAAIPAALAVGALAVGLHHALDAAEADQVAQERLTKAFEDSHVPIDKYKGAIADAVQKSADLGFHSDETKRALGSLVTATGNAHQAIALLGNAQDLARFKGISLEAATKVLSGTLAGNSRAARQLGITIMPVTTATDALKSKTEYASLALYEHAKKIAYLKDRQATAAETIKLVNAKLGDQAAAFAATGEGAKEKMGAELNLLSIKIGTVLIPVVELLVHGVADLTGWMSRHATVAKIVIAVVGTLATALLLLAGYQKMVTLATWAMNTAMDANPIGLIIIGIAALVVAFVVLWKHSQTFRDIVLGVWHAIESGVKTFANFFTKTIPNAVMSVVNWVKQHWPIIAVLISGPFAPLVALATNAFGVRSALVGAFTSMWHVAQGLWNGLGAVWGAAWRGAWGIVKGIINFFIGGINALIGAWDALHFHFGGVSVFGHHFGSFDIGVPQIPKIPQLAQGGIVRSPTLAMIGEAGPEAVIPLGKGGAGINVTVSGVVGNPREVALVIGRELEKLSTRGLSFNLT